MRDTLLLLLVLLSQLGCSPKQNNSTSTNNNPIASVGELDFPTEICQKLAGDWRTYRISPNDNPKCHPPLCGYAGPMKLQCDEGKVTGTMLLIYASMPPPGRAITAPIEAKWIDGKIMLTYTNNQKCLYTYTAAFNGETLNGDFSNQNCDNREKEGKFYGLRFTQTATPNNSLNPTPR